MTASAQESTCNSSIVSQCAVCIYINTLHVCVCMYTRHACTHMHAYTHIHMPTYIVGIACSLCVVCVCVYTWVRYIYVCVHVCTHTHVPTCTHTCTHTLCGHVYMHKCSVCVCTYDMCTHAHIHTYPHEHTYTCTAGVCMCLQCKCSLCVWSVVYACVTHIHRRAMHMHKHTMSYVMVYTPSQELHGDCISYCSYRCLLVLLFNHFFTCRLTNTCYLNFTKISSTVHTH